MDQVTSAQVNVDGEYGCGESQVSLSEVERTESFLEKSETVLDRSGVLSSPLQTEKDQTVLENKCFTEEKIQERSAVKGQENVPFQMNESAGGIIDVAEVNEQNQENPVVEENYSTDISKEISNFVASRHGLIVAQKSPEENNALNARNGDDKVSDVIQDVTNGINLEVECSSSDVNPENLCEVHQSELQSINSSENSQVTVLPDSTVTLSPQLVKESIDQTSDKQNDQALTNVIHSKKNSLPESEQLNQDKLSATAKKKENILNGDTLTVSPENVKENDVPDECAENKENEPLDILGNGLLIKKILKVGKGRDTRPVKGEVVTLRTKGLSENGIIVDEHESITFTLGDGDVVEAWDLAVALMAEGEICELATDSRFAYGNQGRKPDVPSGASIVYTLELLSKAGALDYSTLSLKERLHHGEKKKKHGNQLFSRGDYTGAIQSYSRAIKIIESENQSFTEEPSELQQLLDEKIKCYNNLAAAQLKVEAFDVAIKSCESVLKFHAENVKALFRIGKAYFGKGDTKHAVHYMKMALNLEPKTKIIHQEMSKLSKKLQEENQLERNLYKKMIGVHKKPSKKNAIMWWKWTAIAAVAAVVFSVGIAAFRLGQQNN